MRQGSDADDATAACDVEQDGRGVVELGRGPEHVGVLIFAACSNSAIRTWASVSLALSLALVFHDHRILNPEVEIIAEV